MNLETRYARVSTRMLSREMATARELQERGASREEMTEALAEIRRDFGYADGIYHALKRGRVTDLEIRMLQYLEARYCE